MEELTFRVRVASPLFLSGAGTGFDLRAPSWRGLLRFWFRAAAGGACEGDWHRVAELEKAVFGHTGCASAFRVWVQEGSDPLPVVNPSEKVERLEPGYLYLAFPFYDYVRAEPGRAGPGHRLKRAFVDADHQPPPAFDLCLSVERGVSTAKVLCASLWLAAHFGGLGGRSRRGFGSLSVSPGDGQDCFGLCFTPPRGPSEVAEHFRENLKRIDAIFREFTGGAGSIAMPGGEPGEPLPSYSCFASWRAAIVAPEQGQARSMRQDQRPGSRWQPMRGQWRHSRDVLSDMGCFLRLFRNGHLSDGDLRAKTPDYREVVNHYLPNLEREVDPATGQQRQVWRSHMERVSEWDLRNDAFGLPLQIRSSQRSRLAPPRSDIAAAVVWEKDGKTHSRRASPLFIRPLLLRDGQYVVVLLLLRAAFVPGDEYLVPGERWPKEVNKPQQHAIAMADLGVIDELLDAAGRHFQPLGELPLRGNGHGG